MFQALNPLTVPIAQTNLIEASAGTGKTWNIAALFTRLVLLEHHAVHQILVVTFTKAATAELKTRLRARLDEAFVALNQVEDAVHHLDALKSHCSDDFLYELLCQALKQEPQNRLKLRLKASISEFDNASIYTIHGFCQRVLQDFAFYCQVPFDIQLDEQSAETQQLNSAQDFWRTQIATDAQLAELVHRHKRTPQNQLAVLKPYVSRPYLQFRLSGAGHSAYVDALKRYETMWQAIVPKLAEIETAFWAIRPALHGGNYQEKAFTKKFNLLKQFAHSHLPNPSQLAEVLHSSNGIDRPFSMAFMESKITKNKQLDYDKAQIVSQLDALVEAVDAFAVAEQEALLQLSQDLVDYLRQQRQENKKHTPQRVFDDLLLDVHTALSEQAEHAHALAQALAQNWKVALIDEFQDTDPLQYAIFKTAFVDRGTPVFLVGDPKQAIYAFRGADIFAYLDASQNSQQHYTLDTNHRSHYRLINSIGAFFGRERPFILPNIDYLAVKASREQGDLSPSGHAVQVRWLPNLNGDNAESLVKQSASICAQQIAELLQQAFDGQLHYRNQPLHAGQIAVLVRARKDGAVVQRELKRRGIQSVLVSNDSIFAEAEAEALSALLAFVIEPQKTGLLRFVLAGELFGYDARALQELNEHEERLLTWIDSATITLELWQKQGIYPALQDFLQRHGVEQRLLSLNNERTLTNIHQIMELLAQEDELSHTPLSLLQWLNQQIQQAREHNKRNEHHVLRLESDENLVKIVTMHASKGLQYPIVFCPFVWKGADVSNQAKWFISHRQGFAELISRHQYSSSEEDKKAIAEEQLSEDLRLLYVVMTRAEERLYLYLTHYDKSPKSAFAYLLQADENTAKDASAYQAHWQQFLLEQDREHTDFEWVVHEQNHHHRLVTPKPMSPTQAYQAISFPERRFHFVQHASFTSLSRQMERINEAMLSEPLLPALDWDEQTIAPAPTELPDNVDSIHAFPKGAGVGVCLHAILEQFHHQQPAHEQQNWIDEKLSQHGFEPEIWRHAVMEMCDFARETPLLPHTNLATLKPQHTLSEMNFLMHTRDFKLRDIQAWFSRQALAPCIQQAVHTLNFRDVYGFLNGAIDLVAQNAQQQTLIIDYKSNYLGDNTSAYSPTALEQAMAEHHYYLQAFIYAIATARYLQSRHALPKTLAIRYLFLRGLDGITNNGVWAWDIDTADLAQWL